jgi:hypothetical protein
MKSETGYVLIHRHYANSRECDYTGISKQELERANQSFDDRYYWFGSYIQERRPINWIPTPPNYDGRLTARELDRSVVPWNARVMELRLSVG